MDPTLEQGATLIWQAAMGISLAACAGLRAFLPMFVVGVAGRVEIIPLAEPFEWLASWPALVVLGVAVITEILADKFPVVDNFLDVLQSFVKPIAGTILVVSVMTELSPLQSWIFGIIAGGAAAEAVHLTKAKVRLASSVTTAGLGNPLLSFVEDAGVFAGSLGAILIPLVVLGVIALAFVGIWVFLRRLLRRSQPV